MRQLIYSAAFMLALIAVSNATYLQILGPVSAQLNNHEGVYLGKVGPGESFYVQASASTTNATGFLVNIGWDQLSAVNLPQGWSQQPSLLYGNPMKLKITVSPNAPNGRYNLTLLAVNVQNYSRLGNITVNTYVNVTPNIFSANVSPLNIYTGVGQPSNLYVTINNTGISDDPFNINVQGLPAWNVSDQVVALHESRSSYVYPVYVDSPGDYPFNLTVSSSTSPALRSSFEVNLIARESLLNDYAAVGQGVILSPVIFDPSYEFMLLLSYIHNLVFH